MVKWPTLIGAFLALVVCAQPAHQENTVTDNLILNPREWGDRQSTGYLPVSGRLGQETVWQKAADAAGDSVLPHHLCLIGDRIAVWYGRRLDLRSAATGEPLWSQETLENCSFEAQRDGLVAFDEHGAFRLLRYDGTYGERVRAPLYNGAGRVFVADASADAVFLCAQMHPGPTSTAGEKVVGPEIILAALNQGANELAWSVIRDGFLIAALISPDGRQACLATRDRLLLAALPAAAAYDPAAELEVAVIEIPFDSVIACAYSHAGEILAVAEKSDNPEGRRERALFVLSSAGEERRRLPLAGAGSLAQPPASFPDGDVCLSLGREIWRLRGGEKLWVQKIPAEPGQILITLLKDGSLLAAAGKLLLQLSPEGEEISRRIVDGPITCRPVMDPQGRVYVAGPGGVYCLR
ncbi:MAG TPA: hypothetical protein PKY95_00345 [candidate division Zixibacteria bacterium]|nr:hypothetical protein [candidate division Zixibacteria bacterium]